MIEDKKLGLKVAEDEDEEFWTVFKETQDKLIKNSKRDIEIAEEMKKICDKKLKKYKKKVPSMVK